MSSVVLLFSASVLAEFSPEIAEAHQFYYDGLKARDDASQARPLFARASQGYEQIWKNNRGDFELARNLAQAYLLAGKIPLAIAAYQQGLQAAPHDRALQEGLAYARNQVDFSGNREIESMARPAVRFSFIQLLPQDRWLGISAVSYFLGWLVLARAWMKRRQLYWWSGAFLVVVGAGLAFWLAHEHQHFQHGRSHSLAIVNEDAAHLRLGNGPDYPLRFADKLPPGVEMRVLAERGGWLQVQLAGGTIGWVDRRNVILVE